MLAVTHFVTQFTHVSGHFGAKSRKEEENKLRKNCFDNVVSNLWKSGLFINKTALKRYAKSEEKK